MISKIIPASYVDAQGKDAREELAEEFGIGKEAVFATDSPAFIGLTLDGELFLEIHFDAAERAEVVKGHQARIVERFVWLLEEIDEVFGYDHWPYGLEANRRTIEQFIQYMVAQNMLVAPIPAENKVSRPAGPRATNSPIATRVAGEAVRPPHCRLAS